MRLSVPKQTEGGETRVAIVPAVAKKLVASGLEVIVESEAGVDAGFPDEAYEKAGARVVCTPDEPSFEVWQSDIVAVLQVPSNRHLDAMKPGAVLVGMLAPFQNPHVVQQLVERRITAIAMEFIPRISRAQSMDVLSSQANLGGYKAVMLAAHHSPKAFPMMITAAGTITPARVFVVGVGVAGLQAIATAKRLGAVVEAFDVRAATREQVQSLGARFVELPVAAQDDKATGGYAKEQSEEDRRRQAELMAKHVTGADAVITTAAVFGKAPPLLIPRDVVDRMQPGSVIVDMAASPEHGRGNCEATKPGEVYVTDHGVTIVGTLNLPALLPVHASLVYANNVHALLREILDMPKGGTPSLKIDLADDIQKAAVITHEGQVTSELLKDRAA